MRAANILTLCLRELGWSRPRVARSGAHGMMYRSVGLYTNAKTPFSGSDRCWLAWMLSDGFLSTIAKNPTEENPDLSYEDELTQLGRDRLTSLVQNGWTLRDKWPKPSWPAVQDWLGARFYLARSQYFGQGTSHYSIVSSQIGRHHQRLPQWPQLLDRAIRTLHRDHAVLLSIPGITLDAPTRHFAKASSMPTMRISVDKLESGDLLQLSGWLAELLRSNFSQSKGEPQEATVFVSPAWQSTLPSSQWNQFPIQDRAAIALSDRVLAVSIRSTGNVAGLLQERLLDDRFPVGSVYVAIENERIELKRQRPSAGLYFSKVLPWLDQGAVGWFVQHRPAAGLKELSQCCWQSQSEWAFRTAQPETEQPRLRLPTVLQLSAPVERLWNAPQADWPYLVHCTRGSTGPLPQETRAAYYDRLWQAGREITCEPFWTLNRILREQRLRGTAWMTRGNLPSVSLSAVPLKELLGRRNFRSHLGRWDWEPYGLLIHKRFLQQARPVIYGRQSDFEQLPAEDRVYFQPLDSKYDWSQEREWRVLGDVDLKPLPTQAVTVFVRSRLEAFQLARVSRYPVVWTEGIHS